MRKMAAGFEQDCVARVDEAGHQRNRLRLKQRLAAGDLDQPRAERADFRQHVVDRHLRPPVNAYGVSHQAQRRSHAASRMKTHGRPACVDSP